MLENEFLRISLTAKETVWGWRYLLFRTVFLSPLLTTINLLLPVPLDSALLNFLFFCLNFGAAALIFHRYLKQFFNTCWCRFLRICIIGIVFFALYQVCNLLLGMLFAAIDPTFFNQNDQAITAMAKKHFWLIAVGTVILVPVAEELFHRGLVFRGLYDRSALAAYLISAAIFSAVHVTGYAHNMEPSTLFLSFLQYIPAGLCLAAAYRLSGSLLCPILIHAAVNAAGILALR